MPRNGAGSYALPAGQPVITGTVIDSSVHNTFASDVATALTNSLAKNGETTPTANLPMGGFKHTGVADGTVRTHYTSVAQVQDSTPTLIVSIAGTDTITGSPSIAVPAYVTGQSFRFVPANANTGAVTINVSGLGARNILKGNAGSALAAGDLTAGVPVTITYNGTAFYLSSSAGAGANPTASVGLAAVNGTATTFMRSDGAPALSVSINPTWTGIHNFGTAVGQTTAPVIVRARVNAVEFGHSNAAGYASTLGHGRTNGRPFLAFNAEHGTNDNTFLTRGIIGKVVTSDAAGALIIGTVANASADNQALTTDVTVATNGNITASGVLLGPNGAVGAPTYSFSNDATTGFYRSGASAVNLALGGVSRVAWTATQMVLAAQFVGTSGNAGAPSHSFSSDPDTGAFSVGADQYGISTGGTLRLSASTTGIDATLPINSSVNGSGPNSAINIVSATPAIRMSESDAAADGREWDFVANAGLFRLRINNDAYSTNKNFLAVQRTTSAVTSMDFGNATDNNTFGFLGTGTFTTGGVHLGPNGTVGAPTYSFTGDPNTGIYNVGADTLGLAAGGNAIITVSGTEVTVGSSLRTAIGSAATPTYSYATDTNTGFYLIGADNVGVSMGNSLVFDWVAAASGGARVADFGGTLQTVGFREIPQNAQTGNYTLVLADSGKHIYHASGAGAGDTYTIPANGSVAYPIGTAITFINDDSNAVSIAITTDEMRLSPGGTTGTRTLAQYGIATAIKVTATSWRISGTGLT